ncbi:tyrosine-protein phosphatase [Sphingobium sp. EP60837]|uniref:tyrosine-protein phosphatase n=1 Tax=Sphingobium sp. EP60837 TaxID=1855519 RepID=UPI0007DDC27E|nr:tyrosine-protein phosphatase [Sphingobium sp. EP60837]ANI79495.1 Protein-tyrosine-phosphatase [Sphingobium sp. EP60837]
MKRDFVLTILAAMLAGCAATSERPLASAPHAAVGQVAQSPFTAASVEKGSDGSYRVAWQAPAASRVRVYAGTDPAGNVTGAVAAEGVAGGSAVIKGLDAAQRWYFTLVPDRGAPLTVADKGLHLATAPNFRDVGGYRTADGHWVKPGLIFRSDQLNRLSDKDLAAIDGLGPSLVVDLRTQSERDREPDRIPPRGRGLVLDVAADANGTLGGDMRQAQAAIASGKGAEMLVSANRDFVTLRSARAAYSALLRRLIDGGQEPIIYHCTAGKDRTGWATAVILTLLGVPRETVMADYLQSNAYLRTKNDATMKALAASGAAINPAFLEPVLTVRPEYLQSAFDEVDRTYGSMEAYARDGLGLTALDIAVLRRKYLSGSPG